MEHHLTFEWSHVFTEEQEHQELDRRIAVGRLDFISGAPARRRNNRHQ
jgi:hypothetical protein